MQVCKAFARVAKKHLPNTFIYFIVFVVLLIAKNSFRYLRSTCVSLTTITPKQARH